MKKLLLAAILFLGAPPCWGTITRVQLVQNTANAFSVVVTVSATTIGNLIVVAGTIDNGAQTFSIIDNKGNIYTNWPALCNINISGGIHSEEDCFAYTVDGFGGVTSVTIGGFASASAWGNVGEYNSTNGWPATPSDKTNHQFNGGGTSWTSNATSTTTQASELLFGYAFSTFDPGTVTPAGGWAAGVQSIFQDTRRSFATDQIVTSTGAYTFSGTSANSVDTTGLILTFKDNPTPPSGSGVGGKAGIGGKAGLGYWQPIWRKREQLQ